MQSRLINWSGSRWGILCSTPATPAPSRMRLGPDPVMARGMGLAMARAIGAIHSGITVFPTERMVQQDLGGMAGTEDLVQRVRRQVCRALGPLLRATRPRSSGKSTERSYDIDWVGLLSRSS